MSLQAVREIDTPFLVVDLGDVEFNISMMMKNISRFPNVSVRPHQKTAKSPAFAKMLLEHGAKGICVAKVSEAEVFVKDGIKDILITTEITGDVKIARLFELLKVAPKIRIVVDNGNVVQQLHSAHASAGLSEPIDVLVDLNVGQDRTGVNTIEEVVALAKVVEEVPSLNLIGIQGYEGHLQHLDAKTRESKCRESMDKLVSSAKALRENGHLVEVVTTGGTGTAEICASVDGITEVQPGSFIFMDVAYRNATDAVYRNALKVVSSVISKPNERRIVLDAGTKSLSVDMGYAEPFKQPDWTYRPAGDEYGIVETVSGTIDLVPGDRVELVPSHIDTTVAMHDSFNVVRGDEFVGVWPVAARGKVQ